MTVDNEARGSARALSTSFRWRPRWCWRWVAATPLSPRAGFIANQFMVRKRRFLRRTSFDRRAIYPLDLRALGGIHGCRAKKSRANILPASSFSVALD